MVSIHHTALVVTDLDRSIAFYQRWFGAEVEMRLDAAGPEVAELHELDEAEFSIAMLRAGDTRVELFAFRTPSDGRRVPVRACDVASFHIAFAVDDVKTLYAQLVAEGVPFSRAPLQLAETPEGEYVVAFLRDPDGNRLELVQSP